MLDGHSYFVGIEHSAESGNRISCRYRLERVRLFGENSFELETRQIIRIGITVNGRDCDKHQSIKAFRLL